MLKEEKVLNKNNLEDTIKVLKNQIRKSESKEDGLEAGDIFDFPDFPIETATAIITVTAAKLVNFDDNIGNIMENVAESFNLENLKMLGKQALQTLNDVCLSRNINIIDAIEQTKEQIGLQGIAQQFAVLCKQAGQNKQVCKLDSDRTKFKSYLIYLKLPFCVQVGITERVKQDIFNSSIKFKIFNVTKQLLDCKSVQEVTANYELGNIPELESIELQMALVRFTEDLLGHTIVESPVVAELTKNGRFLRQNIQYVVLGFF